MKSITWLENIKYWSDNRALEWTRTSRFPNKGLGVHQNTVREHPEFQPLYDVILWKYIKFRFPSYSKPKPYSAIMEEKEILLKKIVANLERQGI